MGDLQMQYERTHPFISFDVNLDRYATAEFWMLLGEARSKCEHLSRVPMRKDTADNLHKVFLVKGIMATTAIEGNTLSEEEVRRRVVDGKLDLPASRDYLGVEVDNIKSLVDDVISGLATTGRVAPLDRTLLEQYNLGVLKNLEGHIEDWVIPGQMRDRRVGVGSVYLGPEAAEVPALVDRMSEWLNGTSFGGGADRRLEVGIIRAIVAHLYLAWIHPFGDGNGRVARMVEWQQLLRVGIPVPAAFALSNHYNLTRTEYYRALDHASKMPPPKGVVAFLSYALRGFVDGLRDQIEIVHTQQQDLAWRDWVKQLVEQDGSSPTASRRQQVVFALQERKTKKELLTMALYGERTAKTLARDLNYLLHMRLIRRDSNGYIANKELLYQFLPICTDPGD